tara:strand:+ start:2387 stop:3079 length:693 start_codon:yes stop_codon:yes gene_type:complete
MTISEIKGCASRSSHEQDVYVYSTIGESGYFVDVGAHNGKDGSNTYALEKAGWRGVCIEPSPIHQEDLAKNRNCIIENSLIYSERSTKKYFVHNYAEGHERFKEHLALGRLGGFEDVVNTHSYLGGGGIVDHMDEGFEKNLKGEHIELETVTLLDVLKKHESPKVIEFLDIDIEGAEFEIIKNFPFYEYEFKIICIEVRPNTRSSITEHLTANGYVYIQDIGQDAIFRKK